MSWTIGKSVRRGELIDKEVDAHKPITTEEIEELNKLDEEFYAWRHAIAPVITEDMREFMGEILSDTSKKINFDAAPELLDALQSVLTWIDNWDPEFTEDDEWPADHQKALRAIAKATGETSS